jgi:hypothetical protein
MSAILYEYLWLFSHDCSYIITHPHPESSYAYQFAYIPPRLSFLVPVDSLTFILLLLCAGVQTTL